MIESQNTQGDKIHFGHILGQKAIKQKNEQKIDKNNSYFYMQLATRLGLAAYFSLVFHQQSRKKSIV